MAEVSARALVLIIQAVDREIQRLTALPDEVIVPEEELLLVSYESLADDLEDAYLEETARAKQTNLPAYEALVTDRTDSTQD